MRAVVKIVTAFLVLAGGLLGLPVASAVAQYAPFYAATAAELDGPPGSIIRYQRIIGAPWYSKAFRILYRSTDPEGRPIAVSGVLVAPNAAAAGGHPIVAWAHPTTGVADKCAPSVIPGVLKAIPGLDDMVKRGFIVVATDYPGLGTAGEHPYLVGPSEARAVLDSVRAARTLASGGDTFAVWGHSQGGHAALWTGELAAGYAPELKLAGIAAAAPATLLGKLFDDDLGTVAGKGLSALVLASWSRLYGYDLASVVLPAAMVDVEKIGDQCIVGFSDLVVDAGALLSIDHVGFLKGDPARTPPWQGTIAANTPGKGKPGAPVFIAQGSGDTVVDPPVTTEFAKLLCNQGAAVRFFEVPDATHTMIAKVSAAAAVEWIAARFAGEAPPTNCIVK